MNVIVKLVFMTIILVLASVNSAFAQWGSTRWGMTPAELLDVYGEQVEEVILGNGATALRIADMKILDESFTVDFFWREGRELSGVKLIYNKNNSYQENIKLLLSAVKILDTKYGKHSIVKDEQSKSEPKSYWIDGVLQQVPGGKNIKREYIWNSDDTQVVVDYTFFSMHGITVPSGRTSVEYITIEYSASKEENL